MAAIRTAVLKDKQRSVIPFLMLENISDSEIHARMSSVYGAECYHKLNCELMGTEIQRSQVGQHNVIVYNILEITEKKFYELSSIMDSFRISTSDCIPNHE